MMSLSILTTNRIGPPTSLGTPPPAAPRWYTWCCVKAIPTLNQVFPQPMPRHWYRPAFIQYPNAPHVSHSGPPQNQYQPPQQHSWHWQASVMHQIPGFQIQHPNVAAREGSRHHTQGNRWQHTQATSNSKMTMHQPEPAKFHKASKKTPVNKQ